MAEKSTGQWIGSIIGAVVGYFTGGSTWYATAASMASGAATGSAIGGLLDPPKGPHLMGPRLNDLSVQSATYGATIPRVYGTVAITGNVFWIENNRLKETATKESQGGKGGGGGSDVTTYSYSATFAVGLCQGPIAGVRRIWVGAKLIYDAGAVDVATIVASNQSSSLFTIHKGEETQLPDDRMQAALGVANTPAYRGLAYILLKDYPLADHGNSLLGAQVKVEVVGSLTSSVLSRVNLFTAPYVSPITNQSFGGRPYFLSLEQVRFYIPNWDNNYPPTSTMSIYDCWIGVTTPGVVLQLDTPGSNVPPNGNSDRADRYFINTPFVGASLAGLDGYFIERGDVLCASSFFAGKLFVNYMGLTRSLSIAGHKACATDGVNVYLVTPSGITKYDTDLNVVGTLSHAFTGLISGSSRCDCADGYLWVFPSPYSSGSVYKVKDDLSSVTLVGNLPTASFTGTYYNLEVRVQSGIIIRAWPNITDKQLNVEYIAISTLTPNSTVLSAIVQSEVANSRLLTASDIDVTALTQPVRGYRVASVAAIRAAIEPLQGAWPFDVVQAGYKIKFKPRGGSAVAAVAASDLDAREYGKAPGSALTITREMDSVIPRRVTLKHLDVGREYDQGEQYAERLNTDAVNVQTVDMAIVMTSGEAAALAEVLLYLYWLERYDLAFTLPPTYSALEPADVITVSTAEASYLLRLTNIAYAADGRLECSAKYHSAATYTPAALGESGQSTGALLLPIGPADCALLDIPLLLDATDLPGFPVAMAGYLAGWSGGSLYRTDDLGQTWTNLQAFTAPGAVMGRAPTAIGAGRLYLIDTASVLTVYLTGGELSSVTEAQMLGGANHFAYGADGRWEIIAAQNCVLQGDGSYKLSNLLRGRFGSEWACGLHQSGDRIVLLDSNRLKFVTANLNTIGQSRTYRAITAGKSLSSDNDRVFTYTGVNLECLSPVYLNGHRHPSTNDWTLTWIRRTRVGGEWRDYVDATLGEASEAYEVDIYSSGTYTTLKRTITATSATCAYTSANQVTDFGSNQATLYVKIYQLSANVGRGQPLTTSITR